jgi:hypothetical protein
MNHLISVATAFEAPAIVAATGAHASYRFFEFFTANIRNPHTRRAYARAALDFFDWLHAKGVTRLTDIESVHVAAYIEQLQKTHSAPTAKLRLAALRHLFDWMVIGQIMPTNPASAVRGPRHIVRRGKTPVLDPAEARQLIDAIDISTVIGLRDRALIGLMVYSFARIGAAIAMRVEDVYPQNRRLWVGNLFACVYRRRGACQRADGAPVPDLQPRDRPADWRSPAPSERLRNDPEARQSRRDPDARRQPHLPRDRRHRLLEERRDARKSRANGEPCLDAHDAALRPPRRGRDARRG